MVSKRRGLLGKVRSWEDPSRTLTEDPGKLHGAKILAEYLIEHVRMPPPARKLLAKRPLPKFLAIPTYKYGKQYSPRAACSQLLASGRLSTTCPVRIPCGLNAHVGTLPTVQANVHGATVSP